MNNDSQLNDLLDRWEEARENGEPISLEELCRDHPALLTSMKKKVAALEAFERCFAGNKSQTSLEHTPPSIATRHQIDASVSGI